MVLGVTPESVSVSWRQWLSGFALEGLLISLGFLALNFNMRDPVLLHVAETLLGPVAVT